MDLRGSSAMGRDRNHQRDNGSSERPNILQASDIGQKGLHGEIQWGILHKGRVHHMGDSVPIILTQLHIKKHSFFLVFHLLLRTRPCVLFRLKNQLIYRFFILC